MTNSRAGRASHEAIGYRPKAWRLIPNGFDLERFAPDPKAGKDLRTELGLGTEHVLIGMLARWHPMKRHPLILNVAGKLASRAPQLRFCLAGTGVEPDAPAFREAFLAAGSPSNVLALGIRRDVPHLAAAFDIVVSASSYFEGFPNALGEALAAGTPCVTTDVGDSADVVGEAGFVVPPDDEAALAEKLLTLGTAPEETRVALGRKGRERMAERFELGHVVRQYEALFEELTEALPCAV